MGGVPAQLRRHTTHISKARCGAPLFPEMQKATVKVAFWDLVVWLFCSLFPA
jgi:hypothetical protein